MNMDINAARALLDQAWSGICCDYLEDEEVDTMAIINMPDEEIEDWINSILIDGLTLSYHDTGGSYVPALRE